MEMKEHELETLDMPSNIWKPIKEGDCVKGQVSQVKVNGQYGMEVTIVGDFGELILPSHKQLQMKVEYNKVQVGEFIIVKFLGYKPSKYGNPSRDYLVQRVKK